MRQRNSTGLARKRKHHPPEQPKPVNGPRRPGSRKTTGVPEPGPRDLDYIRLNRAMYRAVERIEADQALLVAAAKLGDVGALIILKERWGVRLPKVEGRIRFTLPWMRKSA